MTAKKKAGDLPADTTGTAMGWKFLRDVDGMIVSNYAHASKAGRTVWQLGEWREILPSAAARVRACRRGFHCSPTAGEAFRYVSGEILALVETAGESDRDDRKSAHEKMRLVRAWKLSAVSLYQIAFDLAETFRSSLEGAAEWLAAFDALAAAIRAWLDGGGEPEGVEAPERATREILRIRAWPALEGLYGLQGVAKCIIYGPADLPEAGAALHQACGAWRRLTHPGAAVSEQDRLETGKITEVLMAAIGTFEEIHADSAVSAE